ncbi:hypothetical protein LZG37_20555 [Halomonas titanicae]|uniref:hypothetical protein n=1 Tax=Vreelandella titanicae TaxID=664683 RepID=UPI001F1F614C|nr:hypothetical protein [Halomonas titanicae]MCE7520535.1 hypothetical protein [Halomonas titanicae]
MLAINTNELAAAANRGESYQHLTPAQTWNAYVHGFTPEQLSDPLPPSLILVFRLAEQQQRSAIGNARFKAGLLFKAVLDESQPPYIRLPALEQVRMDVMAHLVGENKHDGANKYYRNVSLANFALVLDTTEDELLALSEKTGTAEQLRDAIGATHSTEFPG